MYKKNIKESVDEEDKFCKMLLYEVKSQWKINLNLFLSLDQKF